VGLQRRAPPERLAVLVKIEARSLEVLYDPLGEFLARVVGACSRRMRRSKARLREMAKPIENSS
jgi:hypothetical protein